MSAGAATALEELLPPPLPPPPPPPAAAAAPIASAPIPIQPAVDIPLPPAIAVDDEDSAGVEEAVESTARVD